MTAKSESIEEGEYEKGYRKNTLHIPTIRSRERTTIIYQIVATIVAIAISVDIGIVGRACTSVTSNVGVCIYTNIGVGHAGDVCVVDTGIVVFFFVVVAILNVTIIGLMVVGRGGRIALGVVGVFGGEIPG